MASENALLDAKVRRQVYEFFLKEGRAPAVRELAASLGSSTTDVRAAFERLAEEHKIVLQPDSRELLMAAPLSAVPTSFLVEVEGRSSPLFANCVWDALGIPAMLHRDGSLPASRIVTACGCCGERLLLRTEGERLEAPASSVCHFALPARRWWDNIVFT